MDLYCDIIGFSCRLLLIVFGKKTTSAKAKFDKDEKMKRILWLIAGIFGVFFIFKPFNAILFWIISAILNIALTGRAWHVLQTFYYIVSIVLFVYCVFSCFAGYFYQIDDRIKKHMHPIDNQTLKKYYSAIRWNIGSELFSFWCCHFSLCNFLYSGFATFRNGAWWLLVCSAIYWLIYTYFIGERLNPYLFLGNRAQHGDMTAMSELESINYLRKLC